MVHIIDGQSPWQNGRTERAGGAIKTQIEDTVKEASILDEFEFLNVAVPEGCDSRNRYINRSGFSAQQRAFGYNQRLPMSLLSDDPLDRWTQAASATQEVRRAMEIRSKSQQALFKQNSLEAVDVALRA